jgi:hypothetical protein
MPLRKSQYDDVAAAILEAKITSSQCRHSYARAAGELSALQIQRSITTIFSRDKNFDATRFGEKCRQETPKEN